MGESLKERQENELEAMQAIFMEDFRDLNKGNKVFLNLANLLNMFVLCYIHCHIFCREQNIMMIWIAFSLFFGFFQVKLFW